MLKYIFVGPTVPYHEILKCDFSSNVVKINSIKDVYKIDKNKKDCFVILPPVSGGDLCYLKPERSNPFLIGIIDGFFENQISVWHKEILFLLSHKVPIFGASSMGALRAAELSVFGMRGVGLIYQDFINQTLEDDDEVTVNHGPQEAGYPQVSEAMVNIRYTLKSALEQKVINNDLYELFIKRSKSTFYKERNYGRIIRDCIDSNSCSEVDFSRFQIWLQKGRIDQKKIDAIELFNTIDKIKNYKELSKPPSFKFEDTVIWRNAIQG